MVLINGTAVIGCCFRWIIRDGSGIDRVGAELVDIRKLGNTRHAVVGAQLGDFYLGGIVDNLLV